MERGFYGFISPYRSQVGKALVFCLVFSTRPGFWRLFAHIWSVLPYSRKGKGWWAIKKQAVRVITLKVNIRYQKQFGDYYYQNRHRLWALHS